MINLLADTNENLYERMSAMKKIKILSVVLCIILLVAGCGKASPVTPQGSGDTVTEPTVVQPERKIIKSSALPEEISDWNTVSSFDGDVDGDGDDEKITLVTSAERDRKGDFVWSDGQNWALTVYDGEECYLLYKEYVSAGYPYFEVSEYNTESGPVPQINLIVSGGARLLMVSYGYSAENNGYEETVIYDTNVVSEGGVNRMHSSLPAYHK